MPISDAEFRADCEYRLKLPRWREPGDTAQQLNGGPLDGLIMWAPESRPGASMWFVDPGSAPFRACIYRLSDDGEWVFDAWTTPQKGYAYPATG